MRSNQQNQGQQTIKPWSTEIISNYNNQTLNSPDLSALQGAHGWNHLNADHFSMSPPSPCLLLDRDKSPHSSLRQHHKPGIWDVIWFVQPREHKELPGVWVRPAVSQVKVPGVQNLGCRVRMRWSYTLSRSSENGVTPWVGTVLTGAVQDNLWNIAGCLGWKGTQSSPHSTPCHEQKHLPLHQVVPAQPGTFPEESTISLDNLFQEFLPIIPPNPSLS